jgi:hypothetical protein
MDLNLKIDIVENISINEFKRKYWIPQKPVVIKNITNNTAAEKNWSINYFKKNMGNIMVGVFDNKNTKNAASAYTKPDLKMRFGEFLNTISKKENNNLRLFLFNLFKLNPELKKEFPCPKLMRGLLQNVGYMFFGGHGTKVRIHYDVDMANVLHTHFCGKKRVVLISPEYSKLLYQLPLNTYSLIDLDNPDYKKYPALKLIKGYEIILEHGDSLFMPVAYWHYMTYIDASFSVSYRKLSPNIKNNLIAFLNIAIYIPIDKFLNKLFKGHWLNYKIKMAQKRAEKYM